MALHPKSETSADPRAADTAPTNEAAAHRPAADEALVEASVSFDPADDAVEPAAVVPAEDGKSAEALAAPDAKGKRGGTAASAVVAGGILLSRITGLVRVRIFAQYLGTSLYADVFNAALKGPNFLQNMLGEGTLSASFIPVYSELLQDGKEEEAGRVAGAIFAILVAVAGAIALIGIALAPLMVAVFLPGFEGERRELAIVVTRILFPMAGVLVLSAWSLGILNSHRSFFLPYFAPVFWNAAMIATLFLFGGSMSLYRLTVALAWGALIGGALQFLVQLPGVLRREKKLRLSFGRGIAGVREAVTNAGPAIMGRGVVQISSWADTFLASLLAVGAVATLNYATTLYLLPISLFGMSVAAAELPELARDRGAGEASVLRERTVGALRRIAFYVVPSFVGYIALGYVVVSGLYQTGEFGADDTLVVYLVLAGFSLGLLATTASRLFSSTFYALRDTHTPARYATVRVIVTVLTGIILMLQFEAVRVEKWGIAVPGGVFSELRVAGQPMGALGLAIGASFGAWAEWILLKRALRERIGSVGAGAGPLARMFAAALAAAAAGAAVWYLLPAGAWDFLPGWSRRIVSAAVILGMYGAVYFGAAALLGLDQAGALFRRARGLLGR